MIEDFVSTEFLKFAVPLFGAVIAWFVNEWRKRLADQYHRKESNYKELLKSLRGFYGGEAGAEALKLDFLNQINAAWLYGSDEVIRKGYVFLEKVNKDSTCTDEERLLAMGDFVLTIRKDLLSRDLVRKTSLSGADFKHLFPR